MGRLNKETDLVAVLERRALEFGERPLYSFLERSGEVTITLSYSTVFETAKAIAARLQKAGVEKQPVALLYPHGRDFILAFFGAILAGAYPMPVTKPRGKDWSAVDAVIRASQCKAALIASEKKNSIPLDLISSNQLKLIDTLEIDWTEGCRWQRPQTCASDIAFIQYTSGSTSYPKGVVITHENVLDNSEQIRINFKNESSDIGVGWLPHFHDMGLIGHIIQPLYTGIHNYFLSPITFVASPARWLTAISKYRGTISGGPNFAFDLCLHKIRDEELTDLDLSTWRIAYCGSERISQKTINAFIEKFSPYGFREDSIYPCYGLAEATLFVSGRNGIVTSTSIRGGNACVSIGRAETTGSIRLVDPATERQVNSEGDVGEIWVRSPSVASQYYLNPDSSAKTFHNTTDGVSGYMRTGDLGFIQDDNLFFVSRLKNLIKLRGSSYYSEDIEEIVFDKVPKTTIARCVAFSVERLEREELIILAETANERPKDDPCEHLEQTIATEVCQSIGIQPHEILILRPNSLALTTSGKPQRFACRERYLQGHYATDARIAAC